MVPISSLDDLCPISEALEVLEEQRREQRGVLEKQLAAGAERKQQLREECSEPRAEAVA